MKNQLDELAKSLAQSVTRRAALKKFGLGLAGIALTSFGLASKAEAATRAGYCVGVATSEQGDRYALLGYCVYPTTCQTGISSQCKGTVKRKNVIPNSCDSGHWSVLATNNPCSF
jgi:hypothetical protein